jgi:hypothetical protein
MASITPASSSSLKSTGVSCHVALLLFKEDMALGVSFFLCGKYFVFTTPPKLVRDFNETFHKQKSQCVKVHITRGILFPNFLKSYGRLNKIFYASQFLLNALGDLNEMWFKKDVSTCSRGILFLRF